jgi:hypothetical protein
MSDAVVADLFVEDRAHEAFLHPLLRRIADEERVDVVARVRSARGGHGRAIREFRLYQDLVQKGITPAPTPDLVIVAIDGSCTAFARKRAEIEKAARAEFRDRLVVACPDPHVERWYLGDLNSFQRVVGKQPSVGKKKCARDHYKRLLARAVRQAGHPAPLGGIEFASELVGSMDLYRAGRNDRSLRAFVDDLRTRLQTLGRPRSGAR